MSITTIVPIVQRIEHAPPKGEMQVQFLLGAPGCSDNEKGMPSRYSRYVIEIAKNK